jgi:hypothetical protein
MGRRNDTIEHDDLDPSATNKEPCYECSGRLYMAKRGGTIGDTVWLCANEESV